MLYVNDIENSLNNGSGILESDNYVGTLGALRIIEESHVNDQAIFEAMYASDCVELAYRRILESEDVDDETKADAAEKVEENKEKTKKSLIETIKNLIEKVKQKILGWIDAAISKINQIKKDKMLKYIKENKDAFMKKDLTGFEGKFYGIYAWTEIVSGELEFFERAITKEAVLGAVEDAKEDSDAYKYKSIEKYFEKMVPVVIRRKEQNFKDAIETDTMTVKKGNIDKNDIIRILESSDSESSLMQTKSKIKAKLDKLKGELIKSEKDSSDLSLYIAAINSMQRIAISILNTVFKIYTHCISENFKLFKAVVNYKVKDENKKEETPETSNDGKTVEESFMEAFFGV